VVIKTSTRQTVFLPVPGLVDVNTLKPGDLVGVNKDSYLILEMLPAEYDPRVRAMEVDDKPAEEYNDIGGLDQQIKELIEAVVLPIQKKELFAKLGIKPPKGVLLYGPPGTGKTLMARACAAQTKSAFLKLAGPQLVQMFIGDGAKLVRDAFALAKEKAPAIIFIDELDAIGTKRFDSELSGDREVQRTMLELLNQLDGFSSTESIKVIAATNRIDILDPALLRSGRLDRKIEFPLPNEEARARILQIHSRKMTVSKDVNFDELARCTVDFNGAQLKAVCVEAGMLALRREGTTIMHEDFIEGIAQVQAKKKTNLAYYA
jgi:26S proteasome regulatory subunit T5